MSANSTAPQFNEAGKYYQWGGEKFYSVTTVLKNSLPTPFLIGWAARCSAEYTVENLKQVYAVASKDKAGAIQLIKTAHVRMRDNAANIGRAVHRTVEMWHTAGCPKMFHVEDVTLTNPNAVIPAKEIGPFFAQFLRFVKDFQPVITHCEGMIINRRQKYAGTLDLIADIPCLGHSGLVLLDTKTGSGIYDEVALQLNAYARAEVIGLRTGEEVPMPPVAAAYALHIRPEEYALVPVQLSDEIFTSFLYCREVFRWVEIISKTALGPRITEAPVPFPAMEEAR
jgi:hypothetical protein